MRTHLLVAPVLLAAIVLSQVQPTPAATAQPPKYADRWVYLMYNLQVDANADDGLVIRQAEQKTPVEVS